MRLTESQLRRIVRKEVQRQQVIREVMEDMEGAASPRSALGRWAFADQRDSVPPEPNNAKEQALYDALINHFTDNPLLPRAECNLIQSFMKKGIYSDVFMEPQVPSVYRGINITLEDLKALGYSSWYKSAPVDQIAASTKPRVVNPTAGGWASSWSTIELGTRDDSQSIVWNYAAGTTTYGRKGPVGVIYCADIAANPLKFFDCAPLYEMDGVPTVEDEMEAIGMGPITVRKMYLWKLE